MEELRPYQKKSLEKIKEFLDGSEKSTILVAPTGAGKSYLIAESAILINSPLIVVQPSAIILNQNYKKYTSYGFKAEIFSASLNIRKIGRVTFVTIGSVIKYVHLFKKMEVKHVIVDENDYAPKSKNQIGVFCKALGAKKIIGFTATPLSLKTTSVGSSLKMLNETRGSIFKNICHVIQCKEMVANGFWTPIDYRHVDVNTSMLKLNSTGNDYTTETLHEFLEQNQISKHIYGLCQRMEKAKHILVFVDSIDYAEEMASHIPNSVAIHSKLNSSTRDEYVSGFVSGKYRVAINVGVLAVGFDFPQLQVIIHARPTNSVRIWYQTIGRIVRIHPDKKICVVMDLSGNLKKFGKIEDLTYVHDPRFGYYLRNASRILTTNTKIDAWKREKAVHSTHAGYIMPIGKYAGKRLLWIYEQDKKYLEWIAFGEFTPTMQSAIEAKEIIMKYLS